MSSQKQASGDSAAKYRELAQKWTSIAHGIDNESYQRKEALEDRMKKLEDRVTKDQPQEDARFKLIRQEVARIRQELAEEQEETLRIVDRKDKDLAGLQAAVQTLQQTEEEQKRLNETQLVNSVDAKIFSISAAMAKCNREGTSQLEQRRMLVRNQLGLIRQEIDNQRRHREESMRVITEQIETELTEFQEQLASERRIRDESQLKLFAMIDEVSEDLKQHLGVERRQRQTTNECLLKLLEDTCTKIHQHFSL